MVLLGMSYEHDYPSYSLHVEDDLIQILQLLAGVKVVGLISNAKEGWSLNWIYPLAGKRRLGLT
jgi:hypothetical protein